MNAGMTPADRAALEIGRMFLRAHTAEQQAVELAQQLAETKAQLAEFTNGVEKIARKPRSKTQKMVNPA